MTVNCRLDHIDLWAAWLGRGACLGVRGTTAPHPTSQAPGSATEDY